MLFISRTQLLKNIIDSIQGLLLLLILLAQLDYFCSKNFKLILQKVSIWNIISPSILQVFRERKNLGIHVCPDYILMHYITISRYINITISPYHHFTLSPSWIHFRFLYIQSVFNCTYYEKGGIKGLLVA